MSDCSDAYKEFWVAVFVSFNINLILASLDLAK